MRLRSPPQPQLPRIDMNALAQELSKGPEAYAPPALREPVIEQVQNFGELPTKEIDEMISSLEDEIAALKREAQGIRDIYMQNVTRITSDIRRLAEGVRFSMEAMNTLRTKCKTIDTVDGSPS